MLIRLGGMVNKNIFGLHLDMGVIKSITFAPI